MTTKQERFLEWSLRLGSVLIACTVGWVLLTGHVTDLERTKLDAARFERDSARRDNRWAANDTLTRRIAEDLNLLVCDARPQDTRCRQAIPTRKD